jgi:2-polyprenyl-3-methyl-5-hydroxy-6-metoxy-1,4-benzoquinol methylase
MHPQLVISDVDVCGNIELIDEKYDLIIFGEVLEHLENPGAAIKNSINLLSSNGVVLVTVPNAFGIRNFFENFFNNRELTRTDHCAYYSYVTLNRLFGMNLMKNNSFHYYSNINNLNSSYFLSKGFF